MAAPSTINKHNHKIPWIYDRILSRRFQNPSILDIGSGPGFFCNGLAERGLRVTGVDTSLSSLNVARLYDKTKSVEYVNADAYKLPFESNSFDVITCLDFLQYVERPRDIIRECSRILKPEGQFYFHTYNRNIFDWLFVIKPKALREYCQSSGITVRELDTIRADYSYIGMGTLDHKFQ